MTAKPNKTNTDHLNNEQPRRATRRTCAKRAARVANTVSAASEHYLGVIGSEAVARAGNSPNLKGVVHELLFRDKLNLNPSNILQGKVARLTKNPHAHGVDVVQTQGGKVVGKYQLKDCPSAGGVNKTLEQTRSGKYGNTQLKGTNETTEAYNRAKGGQGKEMSSTGISSDRTGRVADNASPKQRGANLKANFRDIGRCAGASAAVGSGVAAAFSACSNGKKYLDGEIGGAECARKVLCDTAKGGAAAGATTLAALSVKEGGKALGKALGKESLRKVAGSNAGTAIAFGVAEVGMDAVRLARGQISGEEFGRKTAETAGGAAGGYGGMVGGAALGTLLCPGIGTAIGGFLGALLGGFGGRGLGECVGEGFFG